MIQFLKEEYAPFYANYVALANTKNSIESGLSAQLESTVSFFNLIPNDKLEFKYAEGKWTFKEILVHVIDTERIFNYRALRFARNDSTELQGFDHDFYNKNVSTTSRELQELLDEFKTVRASSISLYKSFSEEVLLRKGSASGNIISVRAIGFLISGHQKHHLKIFKERYF